jgi:hypothetical protein
MSGSSTDPAIPPRKPAAPAVNMAVSISFMVDSRMLTIVKPALGSNGKLSLQQLSWCIANGVDPRDQVLANRMDAILSICEPTTQSHAQPVAEVDASTDVSKLEMSNIGKALPTVFVGHIPMVSSPKPRRRRRISEQSADRMYSLVRRSSPAALLRRVAPMLWVKAVPM